MKKCKTLFILTVALSGSFAAAAVNPLSQKRVQIQYEDGQSYSICFSETDLTWKGLQGLDQGREETDAYQLSILGKRTFLVSWPERDGSFVALVLDFKKHQAHSTGQASGEVWMRKGKLTRLVSGC